MNAGAILGRARRRSVGGEGPGKGNGMSRIKIQLGLSSDFHMRAIHLHTHENVCVHIHRVTYQESLLLHLYVLNTLHGQLDPSVA